MDALRKDTIEATRRATASERARQTLEMMRAGFRLKRTALRLRYPDDSEAEIDARFRRWLEADDRA